MGKFAAATFWSIESAKFGRFAVANDTYPSLGIIQKNLIFIKFHVKILARETLSGFSPHYNITALYWRRVQQTKLENLQLTMYSELWGLLLQATRALLGLTTHNKRWSKANVERRFLMIRSVGNPWLPAAQFVRIQTNFIALVQSRFSKHRQLSSDNFLLFDHFCICSLANFVVYYLGSYCE